MNAKKEILHLCAEFGENFAQTHLTSLAGVCQLVILGLFSQTRKHNPITYLL